MMLAQEFRIKEKERIEEVKKKGEVLQSQNFGVARLKKEEGRSKFAFVISTKISKLAVNRNRVNRALHEGVRRSLKKVGGIFDFVFLAKKSITARSTEEIIKEVEAFFNGQ